MYISLEAKTSAIKSNLNFASNAKSVFGYSDNINSNFFFALTNGFKSFEIYGHQLYRPSFILKLKTIIKSVCFLKFIIL